MMAALTVPSPTWGGWLRDPRNAVLIVLGAALIVGGGRKWLQWRRARRAVARLEEPALTPEAVVAVADHGRAGLIDLFRVLGTATDPTLRDAAGRALAILWEHDQLIAEEEKAIVTRGFAVDWRARRRYPRGLSVPIPVAVSFGVPFLRDEGPGIRLANLEWSYRIVGAERASLERFSDWRAGPVRAEFALEPGDFAGSGPYQLVLQARARPSGLTSAWELDLPHVRFQFEFDSLLEVRALLAMADDARAEALAAAIRLEAPELPAVEPKLEPSAVPAAEPIFLGLGPGLMLRDPPDLVLATPLPCDLAHAIDLEFEGIPGRFSAGRVVLGGQGVGGPAAIRRVPLGPIAEVPAGALDRPGDVLLRAILSPDPERGWADPDVRSIWPDSIITAWTTARVVRR